MPSCLSIHLNAWSKLSLCSHINSHIIIVWCGYLLDSLLEPYETLLSIHFKTFKLLWFKQIVLKMLSTKFKIINFIKTKLKVCILSCQYNIQCQLSASGLLFNSQMCFLTWKFYKKCMYKCILSCQYIIQCQLSPPGLLYNLGRAVLAYFPTLPDVLSNIYILQTVKHRWQVKENRVLNFLL